MTKTGSSAVKLTELYRFIAEETERGKISYKSVYKERGVDYDTSLCFKSRHYRRIIVRRIASEPTPDTDRIKISVKMIV